MASSGIDVLTYAVCKAYADKVAGSGGAIDKIEVNGVEQTIVDKTVNITVPSYSNFVGTDGTSEGSSGLVPAPAVADADKFLKSDGTWASAGGSSVTVVQSTGSSTTDVMSQNAVTNMFYSGNNAVIAPDSNTLGSITIGRNDTTAYGNAFNIGIGNGASAWTPGSVSLGYNAINYYGGEYGVALGWLSAVAGTASHSVALGDTARATRTGEVNVGSYGYNHGYNNSANRVIGGVYDGQELNDAATVAQGNTLATSAPTTSTVGVLGQLYTDTTNMHTYQCTAIDTTDPANPSYTWTQRW